MTAAEEKIVQLENEISSLKSEIENLKKSQNSDII
jgi:predicted  nucleic acid-binding Zn-ribbon protein